MVHIDTEGSGDLRSQAGTCERRNKWFGGCEFEARYDSEPSNAAGLASLRGMCADELAMLLTKRTYVADVCIRCGKTIKRSA